VSFQWIGPWTQPVRDVPDRRSKGVRAADIVWSVIVMTLFFGGGWMARRNLRAGRSDRRGAARLAGAIMALLLAMWAFGGHHVSTLGELDVLALGLGNAVLVAGTLWLVYLALEPFARRHWPTMLVSWTRLLGGGWRDPLVGRDVLFGAAAGSVVALLMGPLRRLVPVWLGEPPPAPRGFLDISSLRSSIAWILWGPAIAVVWVLGIVLFLVIVRRLVRRAWIAAVIVTLFFTLNFLGLPSPHVTLPITALATGVLVALAIRLGILAAMVCESSGRLLAYFVMTPETSAWYFYPGALAAAAVLALAIWGYTAAKAPSAAPAEF